MFCNRISDSNTFSPIPMLVVASCLNRQNELGCIGLEIKGPVHVQGNVNKVPVVLLNISHKTVVTLIYTLYIRNTIFSKTTKMNISKSKIKINKS